MYQSFRLDIVQFDNNTYTVTYSYPIGDQNMSNGLTLNASYGTLPDGYVAKVALGNTRIYEGTEYYETADEAEKAATKYITQKMAKFFAE